MTFMTTQSERVAESVLEQLSTPEFKAVVAVQTAAQGRNSKWQALEASLTEAMNEARDNMKYLLTLEKYMEPLYHGKPEDIMEVCGWDDLPKVAGKPVNHWCVGKLAWSVRSAFWRAREEVREGSSPKSCRITFL